MRIFFLVMSGVILKDFYAYSVEQNYAWVHHKYYIAFGVFFFFMLMLTREKKFTF